MTLNDIQLAAYRRCGYGDTPATEVAVRMLQWINIWHQRILARPGIEQLRDAIGTLGLITTVPMQLFYALPPEVRRVKKITEATTPTTLRMETLVWVREHDPGNQATGIPEVWIPLSWQRSVPPALSQLNVRFWPTPTSAILYAVDAQTTAGDLADPTDQPLLPPEYHWLLVEAACYEEWLRKADSRAGTARQDLETGIKEMRHWLLNPYDYRPSNLPTAYQPSRLGGMYPGW